MLLQKYYHEFVIFGEITNKLKGFLIPEMRLN